MAAPGRIASPVAACRKSRRNLAASLHVAHGRFEDPGAFQSLRVQTESPNIRQVLTHPNRTPKHTTRKGMTPFLGHTHTCTIIRLSICLSISISHFINVYPVYTSINLSLSIYPSVCLSGISTRLKSMCFCDGWAVGFTFCPPQFLHKSSNLLASFAQFPGWWF